MTDTVRIEPAYPDIPALVAAGITHDVDKAVDVPAGLGRRVVKDGHARLVQPKSKSTTPKENV